MTRFNHFWQPIAPNSLWMSLMQVTGEEYGKTDYDYKKISKLCPQRLQGKARVSSLCTFLYEIMATINSRPLTYQCLNDPKSLEPLTPNHLLTIWRTRHFLHHHEISWRKKFTPENNGKRSSFWQNNFGVGGERSASSTSIRDKNGFSQREIWKLVTS